MNLLGYRNLKIDVKQKEHTMIRLLAENAYDLLRESLSALQPIFGDADLSVFDLLKKKVVETTLMNQDSKEELEQSVKHFVFRGSDFLPRKILREEVANGYVVPLKLGQDDRYILIVEVYDAGEPFPDAKKLSNLYTLLAVAVRIHSLEEKNKRAIGLDSLTGLPSRDWLLRDLTNRDSPYILGLINLSNIDYLNSSHGGAWVDDLLASMGKTIAGDFPKATYRIGGTKYVVVEEGDVYKVRGKLEKLMDDLVGENPEIKLSIVVSRGRQDPYQTLFMCEANARISEDAVVIIRANADDDDFKQYERVQRTFVVEDDVVLSSGDDEDEGDEVEVVDNDGEDGN